MNEFPDSAGSAKCIAMDAVENTQVCTRCLICGSAVPVYEFRYEPKICNECKRAVLAMRRALES